MRALRPRPHSVKAIDELLLGVHLFEACTRAEIATLQKLGDVVIARPGTVLAEEGDRMACFFAVLSGTVTQRQTGLGDRALGAGDTFGTLETLRRTGTSGTLVAEDEVRVFVMGPREFSGACDEIPGLARRLLLAHVPQPTLTLVSPRRAPATRLA